MGENCHHLSPRVEAPNPDLPGEKNTFYFSNNTKGLNVKTGSTEHHVHGMRCKFPLLLEKCE